MDGKLRNMTAVYLFKNEKVLLLYKEIRQNYYFFAQLKESVDENLTSNEILCKWFSLDQISSLEMPFTAKYVIEHFCNTGRYTNTLYVGVTTTDKVDFYALPQS